MNCKVIIIRQCITSRCSLGSFSCKRVLRVSKRDKEAATPASHKTCSGTFGMQLSTMQWLIFRRLSAGSGHLWRRSRQLIVSYSLMQCKGFMNADSSTVTCVHRGNDTQLQRYWIMGMYFIGFGCRAWWGEVIRIRNVTCWCFAFKFSNF